MFLTNLKKYNNYFKSIKDNSISIQFAVERT